jgi:His-Xaa-Ser repeat protein HxsA
MSPPVFIIPTLVAAGFGAHDPAQSGLTYVTTVGIDDPNAGTLFRLFTQDHRVTLAQHRSHSSHSSHSSHRSGGGGHSSHASHTSHRSSTGGYDPYPAPPPPIYSPPPPPPSAGSPRATPPAGDPSPSTSTGTVRAAPPGALPALSGRSERFAAIVRRVQIALLAQGFYDGPINGNVGPVTRAALRRFQTSRSLTVTGTITPQTLDALMISSE